MITPHSNSSENHKHIQRTHRQSLGQVLLFLLLIISAPSEAQKALNLGAYLELVVHDNLDLKEGYSQTKIAEEEFKVARSAILPNIVANASYQRDLNPTFLFINDFGEITQFRTNFNNNVAGEVVLNQTLFDPAIFSGLQIMKLLRELSMINNENISRELIYEASRLYWQTVLIRESIAVLEENSELAKEQYEQLQDLHEKGVVSSLDLQRAKIYYEQTKPLIGNARNQYSGLLNEMRSLANMDIASELILMDSLGTIDPLWTEALDSSVEQQPQMLGLEKELAIAEKQVRIKKAYWMPKLNLTGGFNYNAQDNQFNFGNNSNELFFGAISLSVPIFSSGRNRAEIGKARLQRESIERNMEKTKNRLEKELNNARNQLANALERMTTQQEVIKLNAQEIEIFKKQLELGVVTAVEYRESRVRLTQARLELLNTHLEVMSARSQLERILGTQNQYDTK